MPAPPCRASERAGALGRPGAVSAEQGQLPPHHQCVPVASSALARPESGSAAGGQAEESQGISLALKGCDGRGQRSSCVFTTLVQPSRLN